MAKTLDVVLLLALPASGKSETRKFLDLLSPEDCRENFHIGPTLQLDDYPYVHLMHRIDDELHERGYKYLFYKGPNRPFQCGFTWQTLIELLNEDFDDLVHQKIVDVPSASQWLFDRIDAARKKAGQEEVLAHVPYRMRLEVGQALESEVRELLNDRNKLNATPVEGHTIFIEAARGGPNGAAMPLTPPQGYEFAFNCFSPAILDKATILYIWVTPEQSRAKNIDRAKPGEQSSILHHGVPMEVMLGEYGTDDMSYLIEKSPKADTVHVAKYVEDKNAKGERIYVKREWFVPIARLDNREDLTTFIRASKPEQWAKEDIAKMRKALGGALEILANLK